MENIEKIKDLLKKVKGIREREKELSILRGEHFNIFRILGMEADEAGMHTKFLFELLNPEGTHGKGREFLSEFIRLLNKELLHKSPMPELADDNVTAKREWRFSRVDYPNEEGGIIDLYFETDAFALAIENKVYSSLGYLQLERYRNFLDSKSGKLTCLILLTPFAYKYQGELKEGDRYFHLKYEKLLPWLEFCMEKSADSPILRETIKQYIIVVKGLLGELTNHKMNTELQHLMNSYLDEVKLIYDNYGKFLVLRGRAFYSAFEKKIQEALDKEVYEDFAIDHESLGKDWSSFSIRKKNWPDGIRIVFEGLPKNLLEGFLAGIMLSPSPGYEAIKKLSLDFAKKGFKENLNRKTQKVESIWIRIDKVNNRFAQLNRILLQNRPVDQIAEEAAKAILEKINDLEVDVEKAIFIIKKVSVDS